MTVYLCGKPLTFGDPDQIRFVNQWNAPEIEHDAREPVGYEFFGLNNLLCGRPPTFGDQEQIEEIERLDRFYRLDEDAFRDLRYLEDE
jgi:hypothetical protein